VFIQKFAAPGRKLWRSRLNKRELDYKSKTAEEKLKWPQTVSKTILCNCLTPHIRVATGSTKSIRTRSMGLCK